MDQQTKEAIVELYKNDYTLDIITNMKSKQVNRVYTKVQNLMKLLETATDFKVAAKL